MAHRVLATVRKMFNWGISQDLLETNPCHKLAAPSPERQRDRVLTEKEIHKVWKAFESETSAVADVYKLRLLTAQRGGEVLGMAWDEIDMAGRWWTIPSE